MPSAESATECLDELDCTQFTLHSKSALLLFMMTAGTGMQWRENSNVDFVHLVDHGLGNFCKTDLTGNPELCISQLTLETKVFSTTVCWKSFQFHSFATCQQPVIQLSF